MSKQKDIYDKVLGMYSEMLLNSDGLLMPDDIKKIYVPHEIAPYLYHGQVDSFFISAKTMIKNYFKNAEVELSTEYKLEKQDETKL